MEVPLGVVASRVLREGALLSRSLAARTPAHEEIVVETRCEVEPEETDPGDKTKRKGKARRTQAKKPNANVSALPPSWAAFKALPASLREPPESIPTPQPELEAQSVPAPPPKKKQRTKVQDENVKKGNGLWLRWGWAEVEESSEFTPVILPEGSKRSRRGGSGPATESGSGAATANTKERLSTRSRKSASRATSRANSRATSQPQSAHSQDADVHAEIQAEVEAKEEQLEEVSDTPVDGLPEHDAPMDIDEPAAVEEEQGGTAALLLTEEREGTLAASVCVEETSDTPPHDTIGTPSLDEMAERETSTRKRRRSRSSSSSASGSLHSVANDSQWAGPVIKLAELARGRTSKNKKERWRARLKAEHGETQGPSGFGRASEGDDDDVDMVLDETEGVLSDQDVEAYDSSDGTPAPEVAAPGCQQQ